MIRIEQIVADLREYLDWFERTTVHSGNPAGLQPMRNCQRGFMNRGFTQMDADYSEYIRVNLRFQQTLINQ